MVITISNDMQSIRLRAIDGPFGDFNDSDAYIASAKRAAAIGIEGKWAIHPSQIDLANKVFSPPETEVKKAKELLKNWKKQLKREKVLLNLTEE